MTLEHKVTLEHKTALGEQARKFVKKLRLIPDKQILMKLGRAYRGLTFVDYHILEVARQGYDNLILSFEEYDPVCKTRNFVEMEASNLKYNGKDYYVKDESRVSDIPFAEGISIR